MNNKNIEYGRAYQKKNPADNRMPHEYLIPTKVEGISKDIVVCTLFSGEHNYRLCLSELLREYKPMKNDNIPVEIGKIYRRKNTEYVYAVVLAYSIISGDVMFCYMNKPEETRASYTYAFLQTFELAEGGYD